MVNSAPVRPNKTGDWRVYFTRYGGTRALVSSRYFRIAFVLTFLCTGRWTQQGWWDDAVSALPTILGFALSGYAVLLAFGDASFREAIAGNGADGEQSPFIKMNTTFVHFIVVQAFALLFALLCKGTYFSLTSLGFDETSAVVRTVSSLAWLRFLCWGAGYWMFLYALCTALAATMAVYRIAGWYDRWVTTKPGRAEAPSADGSPAKPPST